MTKLTKPRKTSQECSKYTVVERSKSVTDLRQQVSGGRAPAMVQAGVDVKRMKKEEKESILESLGLVANTPPGAGLVLKTDLGITWSTLRKLRR